MNLKANAAINVTVVDWVNRVRRNGGGTLSAKTIAAVNQFYKTLAYTGLVPKLKAVNCFVPDSLIACLTPLIKTTGNDPWTNNGFVSADVTANGLQGDGSSKYLDSGIIPSSYATTASAAVTMYVQGNAVDRAEVEIGYAQNPTFTRLYIYNGVISATLHSADLQLAHSLYRGYICASKTAANRRDIYLANSTTPHSSSIFDTVTDSAGSVPNASLIVMASNEGGTINDFTDKRLSYVSTGIGLTAAESLIQYNAVLQLRTSLGGGLDTNTNTILPDSPSITITIDADVNNGDGTHTVSLSWGDFFNADFKAYSSNASSGPWTYSGINGSVFDDAVNVTVATGHTEFKLTTFGGDYSSNEIDSNITP